MAKMDWDMVTRATKEALKFTSPLTYLVVENTERAMKSINSESENNIAVLEEDLIRQRLKMQMAEAQAKVAQEVAIAKRIESAEEVMIEEFYDNSGEGSLGVDAKKEGLVIGASGSGRKVSKRVYTFKGWKDIKPEQFEDNNE